MKGIVFTELVEMIEDRFGLETAERILSSACPHSGGAYTAVGTYDHREMVAIISELSRSCDVPEEALYIAFGHHVMAVFEADYAGFFEQPRNTFEFLATLEDVIHVEVQKLYPDAELPSFQYEMLSGDEMAIEYRSARPFAYLARGLIEATIAHYDESITIEHQDLSDGRNDHARFRLTRQPTETTAV